MKKYCIMLLIALAVFIVGVGLAHNVDTQGGTVTVHDVYFTSNIDASLLHGHLYVPDSATAASPAPALIYFPGNDGDCDKYAMLAVELSRRGYVTMLADNRGQGHSEGIAVSTGPEDTCGAIEMTEYVRSLSFVDAGNIVIGGHSMGGSNAVRTYANAPADWYNGYLIHGIGASGIANGIPADANVNILLVTGRDDADASDHTTVASYFGNTTADQFESGRVYGSYADGNARINFQAQGAIHNSEYVDDETITVSVDFMQGAAPAPNPIAGSSQVWKWRYIGTTIAYFALLFMLLPLGSLLLATPFFKSMRREVPEYKGNTKRNWWIFAVVSAVLAPLTYFHWTDASANWMPTGIFRVQRATMTLGWTLAIAGVTLVILLAGYFLRKKENRPSLVNYGVYYEKGQNAKNIFKSLLFAFMIVIAIYSLLAVTYRWTLIDVRIWNSSFRILNAERVIRVLTYFIPFALAYTISAVNIHGTLRYKNGEISLMKESLINVAIMSPWYWVWMIWFGPFAWIKEAGARPAFAGQMYSFFWAVPITMLFIATISTYFFRKTGRVYVGACVNGLLVSWTLLGGFSRLIA